MCFCLLAHPNIPCLSSCPLSNLPSYSGTSGFSSHLGSIRFWLESIWHSSLQGEHCYCRSQVCLVYCCNSNSTRTYHCCVHSPSHIPEGNTRSQFGPTQSISNARINGWIHNGESMDTGSANCILIIYSVYFSKTNVR